mgnify:CR=1 FL=1
MRKETFKYIFLIICCLFVMIFTFILKEALYNINKEDKSFTKNKYIDIGVGIENMYSNRYVDISKEKQQVVVGNNKNEVDNGYFDIKILSDGKINVYINKLFKDKFSNENLIDYIYLDELIKKDIFESATIGINVAANKKFLEEKGIDTTVMTEEEIKKAATNQFVFLKITGKMLEAMEDFEIEFTI